MSIGSVPVQTMIDLASNHRVVQITYRKSVTADGAAPRLIEPYNFTQGKQDLMVRAYQIDPEEGWRFFMVHKIEHCCDGGASFKPRRKVSLQTGEITESFAPDIAWNDVRCGYRDLIVDALADGSLTKRESLTVSAYVQRHAMSNADVRFVHGSLFHRCLGAILDDGLIDEDEEREIRFLHRVFKHLGWSVVP